MFIIIFVSVVLAHEDTKNANIHLFISKKNGGLHHYSITFSRTSSILVGAYASVAELNKLSAPIKGNAGVFVLQMYAKDKLNETFDVKAEEATLENMHARLAGRLMNDLYLKAEVKDTRYLFF